jgi:hypothetical protein
MDKDLDPTESAATDPCPRPVSTKPPRRRRIAALFNSTALVATTALITAIEPKAPPFKGD